MEEASRTARGKTITFDLLKRALRTVQGRQGSLPEDTPTLAQLVLSEAMASRLRSLAQRMDRIVEVEAMGGTILKGHQAVGGIRASLYNAMPLAGAHALAAFMADFQQRNG